MALVKLKEISDVWKVKVKWHLIKISTLESEEINFLLWVASCYLKEELDSTLWVCAFAAGAVTTNSPLSWATQLYSETEFYSQFPNV